MKSSRGGAGARVFISCGQRNEKEKQLGLQCLRYLEKRGFQCYFAETVHTLEALTENIFRHLANSEYALFIDCGREELHPGGFRGSVFVNQELAIAAFLQTQERVDDSKVFHQEGVVRQGVAQYLLANPIVFRDKTDLLRKLGKATNAWRSGWRNELSVERGTVHPNFKLLNQAGQLSADWYHLRVLNRHVTKYARNCVAYLSRIRNVDTGQEISPENFELVWAGTGLFERHILARREAEVDAFFIVHGDNQIRFHHRPSTSTGYGMRPLSQGKYELTYVVVSENFDPVENTFTLDFGADHTKVKFEDLKGGSP